MGMSSGAIKKSIENLPPPPEQGSVAMQRDEDAYRRGIQLRGSGDRLKEWQWYSNIKNVSGYEGYFSQPEIAGRAISERLTPKTHALLVDVYNIARKAVHEGKTLYRRLRPYVVYKGAQTCIPGESRKANPSYSYPSGHTAAAFSVGLMLSKIIPDRTELILESARRIGESRWVCGNHWLSDVEAAETMVTGIVERLMERKDFRRRLDEAQKECREVQKYGRQWKMNNLAE